MARACSTATRSRPSSSLTLPCVRACVHFHPPPPWTTPPARTAISHAQITGSLRRFDASGRT